jgi:uncharacterized phage protein (TIGR02220 family)
MTRPFVKISEQDLQIAEEFFGNEKHFNEFLVNVFKYYRGRNIQIKTKIVLKYFNSYKKVMDYIIDAAENGKEGVKKRIENQQVKLTTLKGGLSDPKRECQDTHQPNSKVEIVNNKVNYQYDDFILDFQSIVGKQMRGNEKTKSSFSARLKEGFTKEQFCRAITNCKNDKWHIENPQYLTIEFILRNDKLEKYLNIVPEQTKSTGLTLEQAQARMRGELI